MPTGSVELTGAMVSTTNVAVVTVRVVDAVNEPIAAVIVVVPCASPSATPSAPTEATEGELDDHTTSDVASEAGPLVAMRRLGRATPRKEHLSNLEPMPFALKWQLAP